MFSTYLTIIIILLFFVFYILVKLTDEKKIVYKYPLRPYEPLYYSGYFNRSYYPILRRLNRLDRRMF